MKSKKRNITKIILLVIALTVLLVVPAFADGVVATPPPIDITGPMTTALTTTVTNTLACFSAIIPIGLTIFAAKFAWIKGVQFFSRIASK